MSTNQGDPTVETCGVCEGDRVQRGKAIVCPKCDLIPGKVPA